MFKYRDVIEAVRYLFKQMPEGYALKFEEHVTSTGQRVYDELYSSNWWRDTQVRYSMQCRYAAVLSAAAAVLLCCCVAVLLPPLCCCRRCVAVPLCCCAAVLLCRCMCHCAVVPLSINAVVLVCCCCCAAVRLTGTQH